MQPDRRFARQVAARFGLGLKFVAKDITLSKVLKGLEALLDERFVLKGGTAIARAAYLDTPRFSEDVDLDVYTDQGLGGIGEQASRVLEGLDSVELTGPRYQGKGLRFDAHFDNIFGERDRVRIELSPRPGDALDGVESPMTLLQSPFTQGGACLLRCYSREGLFAQKLHALSGRIDGKDAFDMRGIWRGGIDPHEASSAFRSYAHLEGLDTEAILAKARDNLGHMSRDLRGVANSTNHFLPRSTRPDWRALLVEVGTLLTTLEETLD